MIAGLSQKSANRLVFALANAPIDFGIMATLTFRERVMDGKAQRRKFQRALTKLGWDVVPYCWVREYQDRGSEHYHFLWHRESLETLAGLRVDELQEISRHGKKRWLVRGWLERVIVESWMKAVGDTSEEFAAFQWGGIVELLADPDSASRYFGSYLTKQEQKTLPDDAETSGRWWYMSDSAKPLLPSPCWVTNYPLSKPFNTVFDKTKLAGHIVSARPTMRPLPTRPTKKKTQQ